MRSKFLLFLLKAIVASGSFVDEIRLSGGGRLDQGRVEVKMEGEWGTICDDGWDHLDAKVVCRMLHQTGGVAFSNAYFGQGNGRILLDNVGCVGDEDNLNMCSMGLMSASTSSCDHYEDAGVRCGVEPAANTLLDLRPTPGIPLSTNCNRGGKTLQSNVRLVGSGKLPSAGFVQVRDINSGLEQFGFVCDDNWNLQNARVVCRELCFNPAQAQPGWHKPPSLKMPVNPNIILDSVKCIGTENSLTECEHLPWYVHDCSGTELATVTCTDPGLASQVPKAEVECQAEQMVIFFQKDINPTLRQEAIVVADTVSSACTMAKSEDSGRIVVTLPYRQCAQLSQDQPGPLGNLTFESSLLVLLSGNSSPNPGLSRTKQYKISARCNVPSTYSASRRLPDVSQPVLPATGDAKLQVDMKLYQDDTFATSVDSKQGVVLAPGGWLNLGLKLNTLDQRVKLVVTSCFAGPDLSDASKPRQALLLNKCIQEDSVSIYTLSDKFWGLRFQPFSFENFSDVTIDCTAYACTKDVLTESCDRSCNAANNKHGVPGTPRRRRSLPQKTRYRPGRMCIFSGDQPTNGTWTKPESDQSAQLNDKVMQTFMNETSCSSLRQMETTKMESEKGQSFV